MIIDMISPPKEVRHLDQKAYHPETTAHEYTVTKGIQAGVDSWNRMRSIGYDVIRVMSTE